MILFPLQLVSNTKKDKNVNGRFSMNLLVYNELIYRGKNLQWVKSTCYFNI